MRGIIGAGAWSEVRLDTWAEVPNAEIVALTKELTCQEAIREALREEMLRDEQVFLIGKDIGARGGAFGVTSTLLA